jgi:predicted house-cleaning noncanonical NTP pyrophosphatase (MazG superfamily)
MAKLVKLVRDKVGARHGETVRPANSKEGRHALLLLKAHEEVQEVARAPEDPVEYGDVLEVLMQLAHENGVHWPTVLLEMERKRERLGGFERCLVLSSPRP